MQDGERRVIAIGGSAGAIGAIREVCRGLSADIPAAVCVVVHVGHAGLNRVADIFGRDCPLPVDTAADGMRLEKGRAYVAPADRHLVVIDHTIRLGRGPRENRARPAIDPLFRSVGLSYGPRDIGVVLTGMLNDGAAGLADLKRCGGITIVQNPAVAEESEMPLEALRTSAVDYRTDLSDLGSLLRELAQAEPGPAPPPPGDAKLEVEIALGRPVGAHDAALLGHAVPLSCPACGGVMSQISRAPPLRFRCQVGHAYTAESLAAEQEPSVDEALRVALRIVEERAVLLEKMASEARGAGRRRSAESFDERSRETRDHVSALRHALCKKES